MQRVIDACMADVLLDGERYRIVTVPRYLALKHHADMGRRDLVLLHGQTWESLDRIMDRRFPPSLWDPRHWTTGDARGETVLVVASPRVQNVTPLAPRDDNVIHQLLLL